MTTLTLCYNCMLYVHLGHILISVLLDALLFFLAMLHFCTEGVFVNCL